MASRNAQISNRPNVARPKPDAPKKRSNQGQQQKRNPIPFVIAITLVAAVALIGMVFLLLNRDSEQANTEEPVFTFAFGISVGGTDVSGMTLAQAQQKIDIRVDEMLDEAITFSVQGMDEPYELTLQELGVSVDNRQLLNDAMAYSDSLQAAMDAAAKDNNRETPFLAESKDFPLDYSYEHDDIQARLEELKEQEAWGKNPDNARHKVETASSEENLSTSGAFVPIQPTDGFEINTEEMASLIERQLQEKDFGSFEAPVEVIPADAGGMAMEPQLLGTATTSFKTSSSERRYNIWKISEKLNGVVFKPGETFSVNDYVGPRNAETGWKEGVGIEDGMFTPQYGGGICQVSTTMYNATVKAEMEMVSRIPHTIPSTYVPKGMDATISTNGPDFKVMNPLDTDMFMIITCDNASSTIKVDVYGYEERSYYLELYSELISDSTERVPPTQYVVNSSLPSKAVQQLKAGQRFEQYQVYAKKIDKATGKVLEDGIKITTSTYKAIAPVYEIGSGVPKPADGTPPSQVGGGSGNSSSGGSTDNGGDDNDGGSTGGDSSGDGSSGSSDGGSTGGDSSGGDSEGGGSTQPQPEPKPEPGSDAGFEIIEI